jgi:Holliday junction resolvase
VIREKDIEKKVVDQAKKHGWLVFKWVSPSVRGVPDRIFIKDGTIVFIEFKAPGKKPTQLQAHTIKKLREHFMVVHVCDSVESAVDALSL